MSGYVSLPMLGLVTRGNILTVSIYWPSVIPILTALGVTEAMDRQLGNGEGWRPFNVKTLECGAATHVYAAFDPELRGMCMSTRAVNPY